MTERLNPGQERKNPNNGHRPKHWRSFWDLHPDFICRSPSPYAAFQEVYPWLPLHWLSGWEVLPWLPNGSFQDPTRVLVV
jgi:hypothetical protein